MRASRTLACVVALFIFLAAPLSAFPQEPKPRRIVIAASTLLDGKGHVLRNTRIVIEGSKIVAIDPKAAPVDYDLRRLT